MTLVSSYRVPDPFQNLRTFQEGSPRVLFSWALGEATPATGGLDPWV